RTPRRSLATFRRAAFSERPARPDDRAPHVRDGARVESEALVRRAEVSADDVDERLQRDLGPGIEGVLVVQGDEPRIHVPAVRAGLPIRGHEIWLRLVIFAEDLPVRRRVLVPDLRIGEEAQRLVMADRPRYPLGDGVLDAVRA